MRGFEFSGGGSEKFWEVGREGAAVTVRYGRIGTAGRTQTKDLGGADAAVAHVDRLVAEKVGKGYRETGAAGGAAPVPAPGTGSGAPPVVAETGGGPALPDETTFVLPAAWARRAEPFRGLRPAAPPAVDVAQTRIAARALWQAAESEITAVLEGPRADPELVRHATLHRSGRQADALGAAALVVVLATRAALQSHLVRDCTTLADDLVLAHGIPFAAATAVHLTGVAVVPDEPSAPGRPWLLQRCDPGQSRSRAAAPVLARLRAHLATAPDDTYAEAVASLAPLRDGLPKARAATSYLVPTEQDWVREDVAALSHAGVPQELRMMLLASATDPADVDAVLATVEPWYVLNWSEHVWSIVANLGAGATGALVGLLDDRSGAAVTKRLLGLIGAVPTDDAFTALVDRLDQKYVQPAVLKAMDRFPVRAARVLAARSSGTGAVARACAELLRGHLLSHPEVADRVEALGPEAAAVRRAADRTAPGAPVADPSDLPAVLVAPPWEKRGRAARPVVHADLPPPTAPTLRWQPGEREEWAELSVRVRRGLSDDWAGAVTAVVQESAYLRYDALEVLAVAPPELVRPHLGGFTPEFVWDAVPALRRVLARCGGDAAAFALRVARKRPSSMAEALLPVEGTEVAVQMADWLVRARSVRPVARAWLERNHASAVRDLVPVALGKPGRARAAAEEALRLLGETGHRDAVRTGASRYGEGAAAAVDAVLDLDPLDRLPARIPARPDWLDPAHLPPVLLADRSAALPASAVGPLCTVLALCAPGETYPGADVVKAATDPSSLARFTWALFERWRAAGFPSRDGWVLEALALCGDDDTVRGLAPLVRVWPGEGGHARAVAGLDVLAAIGTDVALMHLHGISEKAAFKGLRARAQEKIAEVADGLGLSTDQLADRLVPDFGLDRDGSMVLDYGPRRFTVGFDEQLRPVVADQDGTRRKVLPKPAAKDDPTLAPAAHAAFAALRKDVKTIAATQVRRFESAMVRNRRWSAGEQRALFVEHPLLWHLARRLVWATFDGTGAVTGSFRLAEDRAPADAGDDAITLADDTTVGIAHPLHLGEQLGAWSDLFADYEILQPFAQLGRDTHALTPQERGATVLHRLGGVKVPTGRVLGLAHRGWERGTVMDAGVSMDVRRPVGDSRVILIDLDPGIIAGMAGEWDEQQVRGVWISEGDPGWGRPAGELPFSVLDEVSASELLRDLEHLRG